MRYRLRTLMTKAAFVPRFTIRDLLWLTALAALAVSWWIDNKRIEKAIVKSQSEQAKWTELNRQYEDALTILDNWNKEHGNPPSGYVQALERANGGWGAGSRAPVGSPPVYAK
jgi:hypothetical protein